MLHCQPRHVLRLDVLPQGPISRPGSQSSRTGRLRDREGNRRVEQEELREHGGGEPCRHSVSVGVGKESSALHASFLNDV